MNLKSLLFGSAATLMVVTGAQAADLPVAAEPVDYVRVCDAFGTGFYYIPGTETCLKVGGRVRVEAHYTEGPRNGFNNYTTRARGYVTLDARTQSDIGLVRAYVNMAMTVGPSNAVNYPNANQIATGAWLWEAFVQISNDMGTFTAGHTASQFDFWGTNLYATRVGIDDPTSEATLFAYSFNVGNGVSATLSFEDAASIGRHNGIVGSGNGGQRYPDVVANVRIDQGWGSAQIMGALHNVRSSVAAIGSELGWAVGAGLSVKVPGTGISFDSQGTYARGASGYASSLGQPDAAVNAAGTNLDLYDVWSIRAGLSADITSTIGVAIDASYTDTDAPAVVGRAGDFQDWGVGGHIEWRPVRGLIIGGEVAYNRTNPRVGPDADIWGGMIRVQRTF